MQSYGEVVSDPARQLISQDVQGDGCWPTKQQELLLRAALLKGDRAFEAWQRWKSSLEIDQLDRGSQRLLPLLYDKLNALGIQDDLLPNFKGVYRHAWFKNQVLLRILADLLRVFHQAGIQTLVLKGAALTLLYYRDVGLRPMQDSDVLVPVEQASVAIDLLLERGWKPKVLYPWTRGQRYTSFSHACGFIDSHRREFDLHWHVLFDCLYEDADRDFWEGSQPIEFGQVSAQVLNPTDQLLHVCAHGAEWNRVPPIRWVADALMILNDSQTRIDWSRLVLLARKHRLILKIGNTLRYLREGFGAPVPQGVLDELQALEVSRIEKWEYKDKILPKTGIFWPFLRLWFIYLRATRAGNGLPLRAQWSGFPRFLQQYWDLGHLWQVPFYLAWQGIQKIRQALFPG